jgi:hypothetical protein
MEGIIDFDAQPRIFKIMREDFGRSKLDVGLANPVNGWRLYHNIIFRLGRKK